MNLREQIEKAEILVTRELNNVTEAHRRRVSDKDFQTDITHLIEAVANAATLRERFRYEDGPKPVGVVDVARERRQPRGIGERSEIHPLYKFTESPGIDTVERDVDVSVPASPGVTPRQIVQISANASFGVIALCNDGTLWRCGEPSVNWKQYKPIPQPE